MQVKTIAFYHYTFPAGGAEVVTCNLGRFFACVITSDNEILWEVII